MKLMQKILEEEPSKLIVYLDLDDVKASAKVCNVLFFIYGWMLDQGNMLDQIRLRLRIRYCTV